MKVRGKRSMPAIVVAVLALVIGMTGTAVAGGTVAKLTKGQVRLIAAKVVKNKAPNLSVAKANTADSAAQADNADLAANASNLGALPPSAYQNRVAFASAAGAIAIPNTAGTQLASTSISVPSGVSIISIRGGTSFAGGNSTVALYLAVDNLCTTQSGALYNMRRFGSSQPTQQSVDVDYVLAVTAGSHTVRLCGISAAASTGNSSTLVVETVAKGPSGGTTVKPGAGVGRDADGDPSTVR